MLAKPRAIAPPQRSTQKGGDAHRSQSHGAPENKAPTAPRRLAASQDQTGKEDVKSFISEKLSSVELDCFEIITSQRRGQGLMPIRQETSTSRKARQTSKEVHHADSSAQRL